MRRTEAFVLLNPAAGPVGALARWARALPEVERRFRPSVVTWDGAEVWRDRVASALAGGVRTFLAAGGDGTVHALVEALVASHAGLPLEALTLGAVGLGSSNDFHKPLHRGRCGFPLRVNAGAAAARDVAAVTIRDAAGLERRSVLVVSGSAGVVAEANARFLRSRLKRRCTGAAIAGAALAAIARHRPLRLRLRHDGGTDELELSSLSVLKTPWLAGSLRFPVPVEPADGRLTVALIPACGRLRLLRTLGALALGRSCGARVRRVAWLEVSAEEPFPFELDGEVGLARELRFALLPERIRLCA